MNHKFAAYVTSATFQLSLSRNMIIALTAIANDTWASGVDHYRTIGLVDGSHVAGASLSRRGLVHSPDPKWPGRYELTDAGRHTFELLKLAGLVEQAQKEEGAA